VELLQNVPLAPRCTLGVGGQARYFLEARSERDLRDAVRFARARSIPLRVLGGGSNLVIADDGIDGLVVRVGVRGVATSRNGNIVRVTAAAGEPWDELVARTVSAGLAGLECLSGIPGLVGATPIQNVGAYGQEVSDTIAEVQVLDRTSGEVAVLPASECRFAYRDSRFKNGDQDRFIVLSVTYQLAVAGSPSLRYPELVRDLERRGISKPTLSDVRTTVLAIRRTKSMVLDVSDENRRSCGSFFVNPIVSPELATTAEARLRQTDMPRYPQPDGRVKLSAAWLIERSGMPRGYSSGAVGLSTKHTLAVVCHDGARAADVIAFARHVRDVVLERSGVQIVPEPVFWGFGATELPWRETSHQALGAAAASLPLPSAD
jgi:UDP-N-acetylmuramate dehydrogenase